MSDMMDRMMDGDGWGAMMVLGWLFMVAVVAAVAFLAYRAMTLSGHGSGGRGDDALRLLDERYARGEIDHDEYEARRRTLQTGTT